MTATDRLTDTAHWDSVHSRSRSSGRVRALARALLGEVRFDYLYQGGYVAHMVRTLLHPLVSPGQRILEVGSAPGVALAKLARTLDLEPWGVDYSQAGVDANRATFKQFGFDPDHVVLADFFGDSIVEDYGDRFDIVASHGFIEHFRDVRSVVARHVALTRLGGLVLISIPNYAGINRAVLQRIDPERLAAHNLDIMDRAAFAALFEDQGLTTVFCGYLGTFHFGLQSASQTSVLRYITNAARILQIPLDLLQRRLFAERSPELPGFSPYLYYIGRRTA